MGIFPFLISAAAVLGGQEPAAAGVPAAQSKKLTLVYSLNSFGTTEPQGCPHRILHDGGLARRTACIRQLQAAEGPLLILDGGAALFPDIDKAQDQDREKLLLKAELIGEAYSRMGYHAIALGTTDLLLGIGELNHIKDRLRFPILCGNIDTPAGNPFKPSIVVEVAGVKVGVVGILLDTIGRVYLQRVLPGGSVLPAIDTARKAVSDLRGKVDLVVLLSHVRMDLNKKLAAEVEGIDILIDPSIEYGNHHPRIRENEWEETVGRTAILRADGNGSSLGVVQLEIRKPGAGMGSRARLDALAAKEKDGSASEEERAELKDLRERNLYFLRRLPLSPHYPDDPEAAALLDANRRGEDVLKVPAKPSPALRDEYLRTEGCKDCHQKQYENWAKTRHAKAWESIPASGADRRVECISCHTTGYGLTFLNPTDAPTYAGVQCEACHGTKPEHPSDPAVHRFGAIPESVCLPCHNEDVLNKPFSFSLSLRQVKCPSEK